MPIFDGAPQAARRLRQWARLWPKQPPSEQPELFPLYVNDVATLLEEEYYKKLEAEWIVQALVDRYYPDRSVLMTISGDVARKIEQFRKDDEREMRRVGTWLED